MTGGAPGRLAGGAPGRLAGGTYRLQLTPTFGFEAAANLAPYLSSLGVELAYLSPIMEAVPGSMHGYDCTDPTTVRAELGGREGLDLLVEALHQEGLGVLLDIVPNHLSTWPGGKWWHSVLAKGRQSPYAEVFDISWEKAAGRVVLPVLAAPLDEVLSGGVAPALSVRKGSAPGEDCLVYGDLELPLAEGASPADRTLGDLLESQHYRLCHWRETGLRNYRRFFDIDALVGVRVEEESVFARTHALIADLVSSGAVDAVRVDHIDGLADPEEYLWRLEGLLGAAPVVVEKILGAGEHLPATWPVSGTTGYEIIDDVSHALVDNRGLQCLEAAAREAGEGQPATVVEGSKRLVATELFESEMAEAATLLGIDKRHLLEATVRLPVYRTYVSSRGVPSESQSIIEEVVAPVSSDVAERLSDPAHGLEGIVRFQQLTGPIAAKGVEDTAWYRMTGPLPFLEVGGDPEARSDGEARLCSRARIRAERRVTSLAPGTTHDTKRSEDVRSRLLALCEMPHDFLAGLDRLLEVLERSEINGRLVPSDLEASWLAKTCLGIMPLRDSGWAELPARLDAVVTKAAREAKLASSWAAPNEVYERELVKATCQMVAAEGALLRQSFGDLVDQISVFGATLSLSSVVLRRMASAAFDTYQGDETWNLSLVDPDNRREVDFGWLRELLATLSDASEMPALSATVASLRKGWKDGRVKMHVTRRCLLAGRLAPLAFLPEADHVVLTAVGERSESVLAAALRGAIEAPRRRAPCVISAVTRQPSRLSCDAGDLPSGLSYGDTSIRLPPEVGESLAGRGLLDLISGERLKPERGRRGLSLDCASVFGVLPVALLLDEETASLA